MNEQPTPEQMQAVAEYFRELLAGVTCPHCHGPIERKEQAGRCVYAHPCGHRIYQGDVNAFKRAQEAKHDPA